MLEFYCFSRGHRRSNIETNVYPLSLSLSLGSHGELKDGSALVCAHAQELANTLSVANFQAKFNIFPILLLVLCYSRRIYLVQR